MKSNAKLHKSKRLSPDQFLWR